MMKSLQIFVINMVLHLLLQKMLVKNKIITSKNLFIQIRNTTLFL